jgi:hypothetical protein
MKVIVRKICNEKGIETGSILTAQAERQTNLQEKYAIENRLIQFAFDQLYPGQGLNIYRDMYVDTPSVTIIKGINELPQTSINLPI